MMKDDSFAELLAVEACGEDVFKNVSHRENFRQTLFGGQVLAQALMAASLTVDDRAPHSLHAYFLRPGASSDPVFYDVERIRDGNSVSSRRVVARQQDKVIFYLSASFHIHEDGYTHQRWTPSNLPSPEELLGERDASNDIPEHNNGEDAASPFLILPIPENFFTSTKRHAPETKFWIKTLSQLNSAQRYQNAALAFASDLGLLATAVLPHPTSLFEKDLMAASIDHAMWFHSDQVNMNDWLLCHTQSPWAGKARGFANASIYDRHGSLVASTAQEGLIRPL